MEAQSPLSEVTGRRSAPVRMMGAWAAGSGPQRGCTKNCCTNEKKGYRGGDTCESDSKQANRIAFHFFGLDECESISSGDCVAYARMPTLRELALLSPGGQACIFRAKPVGVGTKKKGDDPR